MYITKKTPKHMVSDPSKRMRAYVILQAKTSYTLQSGKSIVKCSLNIRTVL